MEIWKSIKGYEKQYKISSLGRLYRLKSKHHVFLLNNYGPKIVPEHIVGGCKFACGNIFATLSKDNITKVKKIAWLVLTTFVGPQPLKHKPGHEDRNKLNNKLNNLFWEEKETGKLKKSSPFTAEEEKLFKLTLRKRRALQKQLNKYTIQDISDQFNVHYDFTRREYTKTGKR